MKEKNTRPVSQKKLQSRFELVRIAREAKKERFIKLSWSM